MKNRQDYVSNSSSSSFIVSLNENYPFNDFIDDVAESCTKETDYDYEKESIDRINEINRRNLDYCLNTYRLLFLGELQVGSQDRKITGKNEMENYLKYKETMDGLTGRIKYDEIVSQSDSEIVVRYFDWTNGIVVPWEKMDSICWTYEGREEHETEERRNEIVDRIVKMSSDSYCIDDCSRIKLYEITLDTILNTEDLIKTGHTVFLDEWCKDLESLKTRIKNGQRLFGITLNQGGGGMDSGTIFGTDGWDSDFNSVAEVEVLNSECG